MRNTCGVLPDLRLDHQLCFALYTASRKVTSAYREPLKAMGLTYPQYLVMLVLWDNLKTRSAGDPPMSVKQIAAALQLDSATLSPMLKRLEALGLITRTRSTADERSTHVELTGPGVQLRRRALQIPPAVVAKLGVELTELDELRRVLTRVNSAALDAGALDS